MTKERAFDYPEPVAFVVDDEAQVRAFASNALRAAGFKPLQLASSAEVDEALHDTIPQLIVLDLSLGDSDAVEVLRVLDAPGGMSGYDLGRTARMRWPCIRVLLASSFPEEKINGNGQPPWNMRLLLKPYRKEDLALTLREVLAEALD